MKLGDRVRLGNDDGGVAVASVDTGEFSIRHPEGQWGYLKRGVMIDFPKHDMIYYEKPEPDLLLVQRARVVGACR